MHTHFLNMNFSYLVTQNMPKNTLFLSVDYFNN